MPRLKFIVMSTANEIKYVTWIYYKWLVLCNTIFLSDLVSLRFDLSIEPLAQTDMHFLGKIAVYPHA